MEQTANYGLNQWDAGDRIMMEDFNADNAKVEQALGDHEERVSTLEAASAGFGSCVFYATSYKGTTNDVSTPSLTFPHKPMVLLVGNPDAGYTNLIAWQGQPKARVVGGTGYDINLTWEGNTVSWTGYNSEYTLNKNNVTYYVLALLDAAQ